MAAIYERVEGFTDMYIYVGDAVNGRFIRHNALTLVTRAQAQAVQQQPLDAVPPGSTPPLQAQVVPQERPVWSAGLLAQLADMLHAAQKPAGQRVAAHACQGCGYMTCRCGVPDAPKTFELVVERQKQKGLWRERVSGMSASTPSDSVPPGIRHTDSL